MYTIKELDLDSYNFIESFNEKDLQFLQTQKVDTAFNNDLDLVELHIYSIDGRLLKSVENLKSYTVNNGETRSNEIKDITLNPEKDSLDNNFNNGDIRLLYNFTQNLFGNSKLNQSFYIESISRDRTELRLLSNELSDQEIVDGVRKIKEKLQNDSNFSFFRLNFKFNRLLLAVNIEVESYKNYKAVLVKLYRPLTENLSIKDTLKVQDLTSNSRLFEIEVSTVVEETKPKILKDPNFTINLTNLSNDPGENLNKEEILDLQLGRSNYEVFTKSKKNNASVSVDYSDFSTFINFSSAEQRLKSFFKKVQKLEEYESLIAETNNNTVITKYENLIKSIIENFDHYDSFLFYEKGSWSWPKSNDTPPYPLYTSTSNTVEEWYINILLSASLYDANNSSKLTYTIPSFIREDLTNNAYLKFVDMIGHHFDNIWIFSKNVAEKYNTDNRVNFGISKDLTKDVLENFGFKLYDSTFFFREGQLVQNFYIINEDDYVLVEDGRYIAIE